MAWESAARRIPEIRLTWTMGLDFPPTAHPGRELSTAILFVLLVLALLVWGGWRLISLI